MSLLWVLVLVTLHLSFFLSTKFVQETVGMKFHSQMSRTIRSSSSGKPLRFLFPVCSKKLEQKPQTLRDKEITVHGSRRTIRRHFSAAFQSVFMDLPSVSIAVHKSWGILIGHPIAQVPLHQPAGLIICPFVLRMLGGKLASPIFG